jgi:hypothetical protein
MNNITKNILGWSTVGLLILAGTIFLFWVNEPYEPLIVNNEPLPVNAETVVAGTSVKLTINFCKNVDVEGVVRPSLVGISAPNLPPYKENLPIQCSELEASLIIPRALTPGTYHVHYEVTYPKPNPVRSSVIQTFDSEPFEVLAPN